MSELSSTQTSLLSRVRDPADQAAWSDFDQKYRELILRYACRRGLQAADANDVAQLVMLQLVKTLPGFTYDPDRGRFRDYLFRVVKNAVWAWQARPRADRGLLATSVFDACAADSSAGCDDLWEQEWADHHYRLAMETIKATFEPRSVDVFEQLLGGRTTEQIAAASGMSEQAVHKVKQRIRDRVKELIAQQIAHEDVIDE